MDIKKVTGVYFSPAGSTKTVVETTADELARLFKAECRYISLNTPSDRAQEYQFAPDELVVFGCPVYAGRLPNKISPDFARCLHGEGTPAVALVTYGGRAYDNALAEMRDLLTKNNFKPAAGGAFLCRHVFSDKLAAGRPDAADLSELRMLAQGAALKLRNGGEIKPPKVPGDAQAAYYTPLKTDKTPAKFLKAKPTTAMVLCEHCGLCAKICRWVRLTRTTRLIFRVPVLNAVPARLTARAVQRNLMIRISCRTRLCWSSITPRNARKTHIFSKER
nr:ferredoxin [Butyricicoccus sp. AF10-3]